MSHPLRFRDDDPLLREVRSHALAFPEAREKLSHGTPTFYTKNVFAQFGAAVKGAHDDDRLRRSLVFLPDTDEREALLGDPRVHVPGYVGPYGWLALDLTAGAPDWDEVDELLDASYRNTAPARLVRLLDQSRD